jgi:hypothetical protein
MESWFIYHINLLFAIAFVSHSKYMNMSKKRTSKVLEVSDSRLSSIESIDPNFDLGDGFDQPFYNGKVDNLRNALHDYNTALAFSDGKKADLNDLEKELRRINTRVLSKVAGKYGNDSDEYAKAGGKRASDRKKPVRKPKVS